MPTHTRAESALSVGQLILIIKQRISLLLLLLVAMQVKLTNKNFVFLLLLKAGIPLKDGSTSLRGGEEARKDYTLQDDDCRLRGW